MQQPDPHSQHCCALHGCRFNNDDKCTVMQGQVKQINRCGESSICSEFNAEDDSDCYDTHYESYQN